MSTFQYTALTRDGQKTQGRIEAADSREAVTSLRSRELFVVNIKSRGSGGVESGGTLGREEVGRAGGIGILHQRPRGRRYTLARLWPVTARDKTVFFRQLALMLRAGITIVQALKVNARQSSSPRLERVTLRIAASVQGGKSLSAALAEHPRYFSNISVKLVESAEASGELDTILDQIALQIENQASLKAQVLTSLMYPVVVVFLSLFVAVFLVTNVIPKFASFFMKRGLELPWLTQFLVNISGVVRDHGVVILAVIATVCLISCALYCTRRGRLSFDLVLTKLPLTGKLVVSGALAQLGSSLAMLIRSGVTLFDALRITSGTINNRALSALLRNSADSILRGQPLARTLDTAIFPPVVPQLISVGEHTGSLEEVLVELADFYDRDLKARIRRMAALVGPVVILSVGGLVAIVYFAFFLALVKMISKGF